MDQQPDRSHNLALWRRHGLTGGQTLIAFTAFFWCASTFGETGSQPPDYPQSLQRELKAMLDAHAPDSKDPNTLTGLAAIYLDMGDNLFNDTSARINAYEEGVRMARRSLDIREADAQTHFLYAANLGSAMNLKGVVASALGVRDLKAHTARTLELKNDHAPALHMMGMLLEELPRLLGGDRESALAYVKRAVVVAPGFTHARLDLAKMYLKRHDTPAARHELQAIIAEERPTDPYGWRYREKPEAEQLLRSLDTGRPVTP